ncbi:MAG: NAD-glutamate dehydrogenase [Gemmatimonadales bacterium]|nr:MAG: NAD-glutamate dehydrogenase [Gemmatimonadales bacterium]
MSDTQELPVSRLQSDTLEMEAVSREIRRLLGDEDPSLALRFADLFFSKSPPGFLAGRSAGSLARMALSALRFLDRAEGDVDVEVVNPDVDTEGWFAPVTVIRTNVSERPFIVDSVREFLHAENLAIEVYIYPVLQVERNAEGRVVNVGSAREEGRRESLIHCEVTRVTDADRLAHIESELTRRLEDVVNATDDFEAMLQAVDDTVEALNEIASDQPERADEVAEVQAFMEWLRDGGFVFLGYRGYDLVDTDEGPAVEVERGSGLGLLRREEASSFAQAIRLEDLPEGLRRMAADGPLLIISKTNATSTVHRRARMDYIGIKKLDREGTVVGERRFIGLFTSEAFSEKADRIPILRRKLDTILENSGVQEGSHDYKEIHTIFNTLPKEELFLTSAEEIGEDVRTVLTTFDSDGVRVTQRRDPLKRGVSLMVILAKEKFSGTVRRRIEDALVREFEGEVLNYHLALGEGDQARLHFYMAAPPERLEAVTSEHLEEIIQQLTRTWSDRVQEGMEKVRPPDEARRLARVYGEAFSAEYQAATEASVAVRDILELEGMAAERRDVAITLSNPEAKPAVAGGDRVTELKLHLMDARLVLSDFMPILENCGLRVIAVTPFEVRGEDVPKAILYSFIVQDASREPLDEEGVGSQLAETILAVRSGDATNDVLNALVVSAGLAWREVEVLRAYASYGFQVGAVPSRLSLPVALQKHPGIARLLFRLFEVRFDPDGPSGKEERKAREQEILESFQSALTGVTVLADDRALRQLAELIRATLRTNYYQTGGRVPGRRSGGVPYTSFKFDGMALEGPARARIRYEVWVRSSRMEGVHLRGAKVARGGIRYSDRPDDFRVEILGLVKTQMIKNAVIVPGGSKGGFVTLRQLPPDEMGEESKEQYQTLIRGLLDITDNLVADETVSPERVVCYDGADPYLVVAADKGTARFSDVANAVAAEYGFWLGDAFASGGSNGYDHKEVGITARGAWECVKRHFIEMGKDIQSEPFTVVGIGDMSGDVFGNGMLLSEQIRLIAAFDHRDIFIDPDPEPASSFAERKRLFDLGRSTWQDYDRSTLSEGAMIIPRGSKAVELTSQAREALGVEAEGPFDGEALVRHLLRAPVELLWNGGIGTYVKSSGELHTDAGDTSNDAVRVDANQLRAKVVGEGGNLGMTQLARIEYALGGGRLNTDAIDNSGGVDLSDREVNLKILLRAVIEEGEMTLEERNDLLRELQDAVADLVLRDNESQGMAVSLDEVRAGEAIDDLRDLMSSFEKAGILNRVSEALPTWEALQERQEEGQGFTRPELAVLLAYAKLDLTTHLLRSTLPDDPIVESYLMDYFPDRGRETSGGERVRAHRLRREIVASQLANDLVDLMGAGFIHRVTRGTGREPAAIARAWLVAAQLTGQPALMDWLSMSRGTMPQPVAYRWLLGLSRVMERTTRWLLTSEIEGRDTSRLLEESMVGLDRLREAFPDIVTGEDRRVFSRLVEELKGDGAEEDFARSLITLRFLDQLLEVLRVHRRTGLDPIDAARTFYRVSELFWIPWLRGTIFKKAGDNRWEKRAAHALSDDLTWAHQRLTAAVTGLQEEEGSVDDAMKRLHEMHGDRIHRFQELVREVEAEEDLGLAALTVVVRELMVLAERLPE